MDKKEKLWSSMFVGQKVTRAIRIMGIETEEDATILEIDDRGVWLDNGYGNDPSGPFDPQTGQWADNGVIFASSSRIYEKE